MGIKVLMCLEELQGRPISARRQAQSDSGAVVAFSRQRRRMRTAREGVDADEGSFVRRDFSIRIRAQLRKAAGVFDD